MGSELFILTNYRTLAVTDDSGRLREVTTPGETSSVSGVVTFLGRFLPLAFVAQVG